MIYVAHLKTDQQLYLENRGNQTLITLVNSSPGQQQSQSSSLTTGVWTMPPTLFRHQGAFILRIDSAEGQHFIQVQSQQLTPLTTTPALREAEVIPLEKRASQTNSFAQPTPMEPMSPIEPMQPMEPLQFKPMEMRMGNMYMSMPPSQSAESSSPAQHFCTQCGTVVKTGDRFCPHCGHPLQA